MTRWSWLTEAPEVCASHDWSANPGEHASWPEWVSEDIRLRCAAAGVSKLWRHQRLFADLAYNAKHSALTTATGSGKSLGYLLPILAATAEGKTTAPVPQPRLRRVSHTALYLAPTKALAHDQLRSARVFGPENWLAVALDGDSDPNERRFARDHASFILTNPDMLHYALLPNHQRWSRFFAGLRYVVIDEAHRYQGVFGAHVAQVIRRLRRVAEHHGSSPTMLLASATSPNAAEFGARLIGEEQVSVVSDDSAPKPRRTMMLWRPTLTLNRDAANLLGRLVDDGAQTLAFVASRVGAELVAKQAAELTSKPIAGYRGGYLAQERRSLESQLNSGQLRGIATTNALELGVDIAGVDAVLIAGYPGKLSSLWQQAGRAGRRGQDALVVLLARDNPLDSFLFDHPEAIFSAPVEGLVLYPENPHIFGPHLAAAAQELPLSGADERWFGPTFSNVAAALAQQGVLRDRGGRWFWTRAQRAVDYVSLRSLGNKPIDIVESETGRIVGTVDEGKADAMVHAGAVYLHQAESFVVEELDLEQRVALVVEASPKYYTQPVSSFDIRVTKTMENKPLSNTVLSFGEVRLTSQVQGFLRRDESSHEVLGQQMLSCPARFLDTQALWLSVPKTILDELRWAAARVGPAVHAIEHTAIGLLPAFAPCDRWDIGGVSTALHADTGLATIFVHDALSGGSGFARRAYEVAQQWFAATLERLQQCRCETGCPSCVVSPKCGNANQALDKSDATILLAALLG